MPSDEFACAWATVVDTAGAGADSDLLGASTTIPVAGKSLVVLREHVEPEVEVDHSVAASLAASAGSVVQPAAAAKPKVS